MTEKDQGIGFSQKSEPAATAGRDSLPGNNIGKYIESQWVMILITLSGGLQDAYTYSVRDKVFANAQTGNIVLLMGRLFSGEYMGAIKYLIPIAVFCLGVLAADQIRVLSQNELPINSFQIVVLMEAILLLLAGFIPGESQYSLAANSIVSFCCAMQIGTFKKVNGKPYASTMCIGNMKTAMEALSKWIWSGSSKKRDEFLQYVLVIVVFAIGAGAGMALCQHLGIYTIIISSALLFGAFLLLGIRD